MSKIIFWCVSLLMVCLAGCQSVVYQPPHNQGHAAAFAVMPKIKVGMTEQAVINALGQPSFKNVFNDQQWVYLHTESKGQTLTHRQHATLTFKDHHLASIDWHPSR